MTVVALAGDWHGNRAFATGRIAALGARGISTLLHLGDFGIWPGPTGKRYLLAVEGACAKSAVHILVTPGNHEDWGRLTHLWSLPNRRDSEGAMLPLRLTEHITVLPRGYRFEMEGVSFVSLGGAPSLDFDERTAGRDWWPEEQIAEADVERTVSGGYADLMLAHDAPDAPYQVDAVAAQIRYNPQGWPQRALDYAAIGRRRMHDAFLGVAPRLFVHGHYHLAGEGAWTLPGRDYETRIWSLGSDGMATNVRLLDLATLDDPGWRPRRGA